MQNDAFEKWALTKFDWWNVDDILLKKKPDGEYLITNIRDAFGGWRASAAHTHAKAAKVIDQCLEAMNHISDNVEPECYEGDCPDCGEWRPLRQAIKSAERWKKENV